MQAQAGTVMGGTQLLSGPCMLLSTRLFMVGSWSSHCSKRSWGVMQSRPMTNTLLSFEDAFLLSNLWGPLPIFPLIFCVFGFTACDDISQHINDKICNWIKTQISFDCFNVVIQRPGDFDGYLIVFLYVAHGECLNKKVRSVQIRMSKSSPKIFEILAHIIVTWGDFRGHNNTVIGAPYDLVP